MKSKDYWRERFELLEDTLHKDVESCLPEIDRIYRMAQRDIEKDILRWYQRLAKNNEVSMAEARKLLSADELEEFKWTLEEYIKHGKENAIDQRWVKQLENASAKYHISKLEALKLQVQQSLEVIYGNQLGMLDEQMRRQYQEGYYRTAFEVQKGFSVGVPLASIDQNKLDKLIKKPWAPDGKNFSERVWQNKVKLVSEIHTELTRMCITGAAPDQAIKNIAKKMNTSRYNAGRLVMTEAAYFSSVAEKDSFSDLGVEQYEILATLDSHTSAICQEMDGKVFDMKDYEAGVTAPPFHVWCRSTTVPYFNDEFTTGEMRAARGADGKTYHVPADMKYPEWKKQFTGGGKPKTEEINANRHKESRFTDRMHDLNFGQKDIIKQRNIEKNLRKTEAGKRVVEYVELHPEINIELAYNIYNPTDEPDRVTLGRIVGNEIRIYCSATKTIQKTSEVLIHEINHHMMKNKRNTQREECLCEIEAVRHKLNKQALTFDELRDIVKQTKALYGDLKWR